MLADPLGLVVRVGEPVLMKADRPRREFGSQRCAERARDHGEVHGQPPLPDQIEQRQQPVVGPSGVVVAQEDVDPGGCVEGGKRSNHSLGET